MGSPYIPNTPIIKQRSSNLIGFPFPHPSLSLTPLPLVIEELYYRGLELNHWSSSPSEISLMAVIP